MTEEQKKDFNKAAITAFISTVLASIVLFAIQGFTDDKKDIKKELQKKATYEYVDQKCLDVRTKADKDKEEILDRLNTLDQKSNRILELMIEKK